MRVSLILVMLALSQSAMAQTTICNGDECTSTRDGKPYVLTKEEVGTLQRGNSRIAIGNIQCQHADDPETCRIIQKELYGMFPF